MEACQAVVGVRSDQSREGGDGGSPLSRTLAANKEESQLSILDISEALWTRSAGLVIGREQLIPAQTRA